MRSIAWFISHFVAHSALQVGSLLMQFLRDCPWSVCNASPPQCSSL